MQIKSELKMALEDFNRKTPSTLLLDKEIYAEWLAQTYFFVRHSTSLLGFALPYLKHDQLKHRFEHHMGEEDRHDLLALKDLQKLGKDICDYQEMSQTQAFYQSQYYRITFEGGTSLLGYILFLEALAVGWGQQSYENIKNVHGGAVLFLKVHAEEDPHHVDEAMNAIMGLSPAEQDIICRNLRYSADIYQNMIDQLVKKQRSKLSAA